MFAGKWLVEWYEWHRNRSDDIEDMYQSFTFDTEEEALNFTITLKNLKNLAGNWINVKMIS